MSRNASGPILFDSAYRFETKWAVLRAYEPLPTASRAGLPFIVVVCRLAGKLLETYVSFLGLVEAKMQLTPIMRTTVVRTVTKVPGNRQSSTIAHGSILLCILVYRTSKLALSISSLLASVAILLACNHDPQKMSKNPPGTVIFRSNDGRILTAEDLRGATGTFRYEIIGEGGVPAEAKSLHQRGREAGARGDYKTAIALLEHASQVAPSWPYPVYDTAYTYLLMNDYDAARKYYRRTVELSPRGFFTAITAADTLTREAKGELPAGTYLAYVSLEGVDDPAKKAEAVQLLAKRVPEFAPAWKELAAITDDDSDRLAIIEKGLAAHPDPETKGMLQINKAIVLSLKGNRKAAVQILGDLALDQSSTFGTEHSAKAALAILSSQ